MISSASLPLPSSSPALRLRLSGAITVASRSPTPASPLKVSRSAPFTTAKSTHSFQTAVAAMPAAFRPWGSAAAAASTAAFLAAPAVSRPPLYPVSARRSVRPGRKRRPAGCAGLRRQDQAPERPNPKPPRGRGPGHRGRNPPCLDPLTDVFGRQLSFRGDEAFANSSTPVRLPIRSATAPTAWG